MSWKKEISQIKLREKLAKQQGGPEAVKLQHNKGRLTLRERIDLLLDKESCLLYTSPSPRDMRRSRMPSSA